MTDVALLAGLLPDGTSLPVRFAAAAGAALAVGFAFGRWFVDWLNRTTLREDRSKKPSQELETRTQDKARVPTMGGLIIVVATAAGALVASPLTLSLVLGIAMVVGMSAIGFVDDWIKLTRAGRDGFRSREKLALQLLVAGLVIGAHFIWVVPGQPQIDGGWSLGLRGWLGTGIVAAAAAVFVMVGCVNAVNLTDGIDGLASGNAAVVAVALTGAGFFATSSGASVPLPVDMAVLLTALAGACLTFLWFNAYPARVFMGDTGSLALGGALGYAAIALQQELVLAVAGGVFVVETLSVILQVGSFKLRKKRIFKIAPLHHHYQFVGWPESRITVRFWILAAICGAGSLLWRPVL